jgi:hypothetical protein
MKPIAFTLLAMAAGCGSAWAAATPPPTAVRASEIQAVDAQNGSFVLEWSPALAPDGKPYAKYVISSMCTYQGVPGGGSFTGANGGQIEWTGPPFKVRATCSCLGKTPTWPVLTQQPNPYAPRSVPVYAPWFQLPCLQPARGPL